MTTPEGAQRASLLLSYHIVCAKKLHTVCEAIIPPSAEDFVWKGLCDEAAGKVDSVTLCGFDSGINEGRSAYWMGLFIQVNA